jgi:hypothetical protein
MTPDTRFLTTPQPKAAATDDRSWYVRAQDTVYGPFDDKTVWTYVQEGRVTAQSSLSLRPDGGYMAARDWLEIAHWFTVPSMETAEPTPEPVVEPIETMLALVVADIQSGRTAIFTQAMESIGAIQPLSNSAWLLEATLSPENIRSILGPTLSVSDRLLVLDATHADVATYNFGFDAETADRLG